MKYSFLNLIMILVWITLIIFVFLCNEIYLENKIKLIVLCLLGIGYNCIIFKISEVLINFYKNERRINKEIKKGYGRSYGYQKLNKIKKK